MQKKFEELLKGISNDILTEEVKKDIATMFQESVDEQVKDRLQLEMANELAKLDKDHTEKLEKLIEAIDTDHTSKFQAVIKKVDEVHTAKLQKVIEKYENELKQGAISFRDEMVKKVSLFLDNQLTKTIPVNHLTEAVKNIKARKLLDEIKAIVSVDEEFVNENIKSALKDGHQTIESLRAELNKQIQENINVSQELDKTSAQLILEKKTKDLSEDKKTFVTKILEGKKAQDIEKNFAYVLEMFNKDHAEKMDIVKEQVKEQIKVTSKVLSNKIDTPKRTIVESVQDSTSEFKDDSMTSYVEELKKQEGLVDKIVK